MSKRRPQRSLRSSHLTKKRNPSRNIKEYGEWVFSQNLRRAKAEALKR